MKHSEKLDQLAVSLVAVQKLVLEAIKDTENPFLKKKYANLESVWNALRGPLTDNGLCVIQSGGDDKTLETTLLHTSGQWISGSLPLGDKTQTAQDIVAAVTYLRRAGLAAITGLVQVDDDGEFSRKPADISRHISELMKATTGAQTREIWESFPVNVQNDQRMIELKDELKKRLS